MVIIGRFQVKQWPDGSVVFDRQFGDTHALDPVVSSIFIALVRDVVERADLLRQIAPFYLDETSEGLDAHLDDVLVQLDKLGLMKADIN